MYRCDPAWHGGDTTVTAPFFIRPIDTPELSAPMFACCEDHLGRAMRLMMTRHGWPAAKVVDVSGRAEYARSRAAAE